MTTRIGSHIPVPRLTARIGVARRDITPPIGIRAKNWGAADWETATGVHRPMTLTAIATIPADGGPAQLLIAIDATWWRRVGDERAVRGRVIEELGLEEANVLVALSHTHSGAVLCSTDVSLPGGHLIPGYLHTIAESAVAAAGEALAGSRPARIEWATGACSLAANRELDVEGRPLVGFNPERTADETVIVGRVTSDEGTALATIVNYACHPTTLAWENRLISPDYVGGMRALVEETTGAPCLFVQGASGDLAPREQYTGDVGVADRHGRALGHAVLAALDTLPRPGTELELTGSRESGAPLALWRPEPSTSVPAMRAMWEAVELPVVDLPTIEELGRRWAHLDEPARRERLARARNLRDGYITGPTVQHPVWAWRWGDAIVVAQPGEAYSRLQLTLRERFPDRPVIVMNLTNGPGFVYLPTQDAYDRGAYQAWQTPLAPGALDRLEEHAGALVQALLDAP